MEFLIQILEQWGFPVAVCAILMWYINKKDSQHKDEVDKLSTAFENNTLVLQQLVDKFEIK